jgi:hypothetical protein
MQSCPSGTTDRVLLPLFHINPGAKSNHRHARHVLIHADVQRSHTPTIN